MGGGRPRPGVTLALTVTLSPHRAHTACISRARHQDIIQKVAQLQLNIAAIVAHLPNVPHLTRMFEAFNFRPVSGTFRERGVAVARFALLPADVTKGVAAIAAINAHAPQFGTGTGVVDGPAVAAAAAPAMAPPGSS